MPFSAILIRALSVLVILGVPLLTALLLEKKLSRGWKIFGIGMVTFVGSQALHLPFNTFLLNPLFSRLGLSVGKGGWGLVWVALLLGLSAGIFEECARYLVYRFWLSKRASWKEGVMLGVGHGGVEAILVGLLVLLALVQALVLDPENLPVSLSGEEALVVASQLETYWAMPWHEVLLAAVERLAAMSFHVGASVMVWRVFRRQNGLWLVGAVLWHTMLDAFAVWGIQELNVYLVEGVLLLMGGISLGMAFLLREDDPVESVEGGWPRREISRAERPVSREALDDSRYQ